MGISKTAAILALTLGLVAQAASADDRMLQVSAIILSKCSISAGSTNSPAAVPTSLRCTGSDAPASHRVLSTNDAPAVDAAQARKSQNDAVVTIEF